MEFQVHDFRNAQQLLDGGMPWADLNGVISGMSSGDILEAHDRLNQPRRTRGLREIAGGQSAINALFRERLQKLGWTSEPRLFPARGQVLRGWKMDFLKDAVGVEVSFNHAEAIAWTFTRLNIAGESDEVDSASRIKVGVAIFPARSMKVWARMDEAVGDFERAREWLRIMKPIMPLPILVVGLESDASWEAGPFRGTFKGTRTSN